MIKFNTRSAALAAVSAFAITAGFAGAATAQNATTTLRGAVYDGPTADCLLYTSDAADE